MRFTIGTHVKTLKEVFTFGYNEGARDNCKWGVKGTIVEVHDSHGLCYIVLHTDGSRAPYEPEELKEIK